MTEALSFTRTTNPQPATAQRRAEVLENPGFGRFFTDHMVTIRYEEGRGWHDAKLEIGRASCRERV